jgi:hypothetical protein
MKSAFSSCLLLSLGIAAPVDTANAKSPVLAYTSSGSCLASPNGFDSNLQPVNSGVAWRTTFNALGSADADGNIAEVGQSVDSASFGVGPRMHIPAASAYKDTFSSTVTGPDGDGSFTLHVGTLSGIFTAGPNAGLTFTISGFELKGWIGNNGLSVYGSTGSPVIQTFSLSNATSFQRICTLLTVSTSPLQ